MGKAGAKLKPGAVIPRWTESAGTSRPMDEGRGDLQRR